MTQPCCVCVSRPAVSFEPEHACTSRLHTSPPLEPMSTLAVIPGCWPSPVPRCGSPENPCRPGEGVWHAAATVSPFLMLIMSPAANVTACGHGLEGAACTRPRCGSGWGVRAGPHQAASAGEAAPQHGDSPSGEGDIPRTRPPARLAVTPEARVLSGHTSTRPGPGSSPAGWPDSSCGKCGGSRPGRL